MSIIPKDPFAVNSHLPNFADPGNFNDYRSSEYGDIYARLCGGDSRKMSESLKEIDPTGVSRDQCSPLTLNSFPFYLKHGLEILKRDISEDLGLRNLTLNLVHVLSLDGGLAYLNKHPDMRGYLEIRKWWLNLCSSGSLEKDMQKETASYLDNFSITISHEDKPGKINIYMLKGHGEIIHRELGFLSKELGMRASEVAINAMAVTLSFQSSQWAEEAASQSERFLKRVKLKTRILEVILNECRSDTRKNA